MRRVPLFGLGCVAGAAGVARLNDYLRGAPDGVAALVSVELCSLTYPGYKPSLAGLVGSALFADGAAAVVAVGERRAEQVGAGGPDILDSRSHLYPDSLRTMGYDVGAAGFELVLSKDLATVVEQYIGEDVTRFLGAHGLTTTDIGAWVSHPGGPKIIDAINASLEPAAGGPGADLAFAGRDRQSLVGVGAARAAGHHRQTAAQRKPRPDDRDGSGILFRTRVAALALMALLLAPPGFSDGTTKDASFLAASPRE